MTKFFYLSEKIYKIFLLLLFSVLLSKSNGIESLGSHAILFAAFNVTTAILTFGGEIIFRTNSSKIENIRLFYILFIRLSIALLLFIPYWIFLSFFLKLVPHHSVILIATLFLSIFNFSDSIAIKSGKYKLLFKITFVVLTLGMILKFIILYCEYNIIYKILVDAFELLLINIAYFKFIYNKFYLKVKFKLNILKAYLFAIYRLFLNNLISFGSQRFDLFIGSKFFSIYEIGIYSIATQVWSIITIITSVYISTKLTKYVDFRNNLKKLLILALNQCFGLITLISIFLLLWFIFGKYFLNYFFGPTSLNAFHIVLILSFYFLIQGFCQIFVQCNIVRRDYLSGLFRSVIYVFIFILLIYNIDIFHNMEQFIYISSVSIFLSFWILILGLYYSFKND